MRKIFCSFSDSRLHKSKKRLLEQVEKLNIYDDIKLYSELDFDQQYFDKNSHLLNIHTRGFGYWMWKPYIVKKTLDEFSDDGDIVHYADIGCWINNNTESKKMLNNYFSEVEKHPSGLLAFSFQNEVEKGLLSRLYPESTWTKADLFSHLNLSHDSAIGQSEQIVATTFFIRKNVASCSLINNWYEISLITHLIDNSPSKLPNDPNFIEHRFDQSIFSLLCKINSVKQVSLSQIYLNAHNLIAGRRDSWSSGMASFPIWAMRHKEMSLFDTLKIFAMRLRKKLLQCITFQN